MDRNTWHKDGTLFPVPVAAGIVIYGGHLVCADADGFAVPADADATLSVLGISDEMVDNTHGADGSLSVTVYRTKSFCMANSTAAPVTQEMVGKNCYVEDSITVCAGEEPGEEDAPAAAPVAGKVLEVTPDGVWVYI